MHFVKKTQVDDDEKSAYEKKRAAKLDHFLQARNRIFDKRIRGEYDEEIMALTAEILTKHTDIYTLWNIRREALKQFFEKAEESEEEKNSRKEKLLDGELRLTQECLTNNPKSYSSWHHRFLIIRQNPKKYIQAELALCEHALALDCRNFHCWDHRRSVARLAELGDSDEIGFSDRLIGKNPSNYSAWHYHGTLLSKNDSADFSTSTISDECLSTEFEKVLHVCGVNSEDQTAWTYCRWLIELAMKSVPFAPLELIAARFLNSTSVIAIFSKAVNKEFVKSTFGLSEAHETEADTKFFALSQFKSPACAKKFQVAHVWRILSVSSPLNIFRISPLDTSEVTGKTLTPQQIGTIKEDVTDPYHAIYLNDSFFKKYFATSTACTKETQRKCLNELKNLCEQLLQEEDNPWALSALTRSIIALEGISEKTIELGKANCDKLKKIDTQRAEMYKELFDRYGLVLSMDAESGQEEKSQLENLFNGLSCLTSQCSTFDASFRYLFI